MCGPRTSVEEETMKDKYKTICARLDRIERLLDQAVLATLPHKHNKERIRGHIKQIQVLIGADVDGIFGPETLFKLRRGGFTERV